MDEVDLIHRARAGDGDAFSDLVRLHQAWLIRYGLYLTGSQAEAEDVAQEAFVRAHKHLGELHSPGALKGWLRKIATRVAFNRGRDRKTRRGYEEQVQPPERSSLEDRAAAREALAAVLSTLPYPYREILILFHVEEMSIKEIAELLDLGESAAKMRLSRARKEFKRVYEDVVDE